jgi:hypothetical protein
VVAVRQNQNGFAAQRGPVLTHLIVTGTKGMEVFQPIVQGNVVLANSSSLKTVTDGQEIFKPADMENIVFEAHGLFVAMWVICNNTSTFALGLDAAELAHLTSNLY